ncbi:MAG: universal stress protein [Rhodospirillales bacterium]|nr:universal stress protein [Rhodospirillales bacterium]
MPNNAPVQERVFLVVVDETEELRVALRYAARRAQHTGGRVALLYVIEPTELQHWGAVESLMKEERREEAEALLQKLAAEVTEIAGTMPIIYIREGRRRDELLALIDEEKSISILVLAASTGSEGPGPLITAVTGKLAARLRIPVTIVPGGLTDDEIDALA